MGRAASERNIFEWFGKNRNAKRQVVIFVHGFNNTYSDAVFRFAQIMHDSATDAAPILFTWPSRGNVFDYLYDKESTNFSRRALEDMILQAAKSPDVGEVDRVGIAAVRTADLAGSAAKVAVAAPMSIISDDARQVLKQQFSQDAPPLVDGHISY